MARSEMNRRRLLQQGGAAVAGLSVLRVAGPTFAFQTPATGEVIPWLDTLEPNPAPEAILQQLNWEDLESWQTPPDQFFAIKHYNLPELSEQDWTLEIDGLVAQPITLTLSDLKARTRQEVAFTIECSGNSSAPFFLGGVSNAIWAGTSLSSLLDDVGVLDEGIEVVFWGADAGEQTYRDVTVTEHFARSMSLADAMAPDNLIAYEMNGRELPMMHGYPARLIAPGWYGVANVKWLTRIEVRDARYQGFFMAHDYVSIREEEREGETFWTFTSVTHDRLKSAPAKVTRQDDRYTVMGAAWGAPIGGVEVQIDDDPWQAATLTDGEGSEYAWVFWTFDWGSPDAGEHTVTSRATDVDGNVQPAPDDPLIANKATFWEANGHITRRVRI